MRKSFGIRAATGVALRGPHSSSTSEFPMDVSNNGRVCERIPFCFFSCRPEAGGIVTIGCGCFHKLERQRIVIPLAMLVACPCGWVTFSLLPFRTIFTIENGRRGSSRSCLVAQQIHNTARQALETSQCASFVIVDDHDTQHNHQTPCEIEMCLNAGRKYRTVRKNKPVLIFRDETNGAPPLHFSRLQYTNAGWARVG